jgi:hypothetical protein
VLQNPVKTRFKHITKRKIKKLVEPIHIWRSLPESNFLMIMERQVPEKLKITGLGHPGTIGDAHTILTSRMHKPGNRWTILGNAAEKTPEMLRVGSHPGGSVSTWSKLRE